MKTITALICTILGDLRSEGGDLVVAFRGSFFRFLLGSEPELFAHSIDESDNSPMVFAMRFFGIANFEKDRASAGDAVLFGCF